MREYAAEIVESLDRINNCHPIILSISFSITLSVLRVVGDFDQIAPDMLAFKLVDSFGAESYLTEKGKIAATEQVVVLCICSLLMNGTRRFLEHRGLFFRSLSTSYLLQTFFGVPYPDLRHIICSVLDNCCPIIHLNYDHIDMASDKYPELGLSPNIVSLLGTESFW